MSKIPKPLFDFVIILPEKEESKEEKGWEVPDELKAKPQRGKVVRVGRGIQSTETGVWIQMQVTENDIVLFPKFKGNPLNYDGTEYLILKQTELQLIF